MANEYRLVYHWCGHGEKVPYNQPTRMFEAQVRIIRSTRCDWCRKSGDEQSNLLDGCLPMDGSEETIAQAERIRARVLSQAKALHGHATGGELDAFDELLRRIRCLNDPQWWIEHRRDAIALLVRDIEVF